MTELMRELQKLLEHIGWSMEHRGCGFYQIINHNLQSTQFQLRNDELRVTGDIFGENEFGQDGSVHFNLKYCEFEHSQNDMVSIMAKGSKNVFISFYNHSDKSKENKQEVSG